MKTIHLLLLLMVAMCILACGSPYDFERPIVGSEEESVKIKIDSITLSWSKDKLDATLYLTPEDSSFRLRIYHYSPRVECSFYTDSTFGTKMGAAYTFLLDSTYFPIEGSINSFKVTVPFYSFGSNFDHYTSFAIKDVRLL